jgi:hypothetical protein
VSIAIQSVIAVLAVLLPVAGLAQTTPSKPAESVRISGRVVFPDGNPVSVYVAIARIDGAFLTHGRSVITDVHGIFSLVVEPGYQYRIHLRGYGIKNQKTADTTSGKDLDVGDLVFEKCAIVGPLMGKPPTAHDLVGDLKPDQIIIEPRNDWWSAKMDLPESTYTESVGPGRDVDLPPCWTAPSLENRKYWEPWPMIMLDRAVSIESFVGGKVKTIRVRHYDPKLTALQIRDEIRKVWLGLFTEAYSSIIWSEMNRWNIKASVECEDGKRTWILTDGIHVQVQDRDGKYWFIRL